MQAVKWDKQIQAELEEADIIVYLVSHNFMSSEYIMEKEVKKGLKLVEENPSEKIICVFVCECMWSQWENLEKKYNEEVGEKAIFSDSMDLSQYQFLPYHQYKNNEGTVTREEIVGLEQWGHILTLQEMLLTHKIASRILKEL